MWYTLVQVHFRTLWNTLVHYYFALQKCHESKNRCQSFFFMLLISGPYASSVEEIRKGS